MRRLVLGTALVVGAVALTATLAVATRAGAAADDELQAAKAASGRYHSVEQALKDGYSGVGEPCVASPAGAMGIHYVNGPLMGDDAIDPLRPEILLYIPGEDGKLKLIGVEYFKVDADQDLGTADDRPSVFGQPFDGPMPGHNPTMPIHYDLHVWFWEDNPSGMFAPFNPTLSC
jgi:hypothetical protein